MGIWVAGDSTSQTLTVYIENDSAGDKDDDEVHLKVWYPSESGVSQYAYESTRLGLFDTPAPVTDDTGSTWGGSLGNHQKLQQAILPDYSGLVYWQVGYSHRNATPDVLYVDPRPEIS